MASPLLVWELLVDRRVVGVVGKKVNTRDEICGLRILTLDQTKLQTAKSGGLSIEIRCSPFAFRSFSMLFRQQCDYDVPELLRRISE